MSYPLHQCRLYRVTSPKMLADRLRVTGEELEDLLNDPAPYKRWVDRKTGRPIQEPRPRLARVHRRVALLLSRVETPEYLHSAQKGRSYISNAQAHSVDDGCAKIDIRKFYPSTRAQAVFHFFQDGLLCEGDVAGMLTKLLTVDGHLPTGSSASPILSYFAYKDMFDEIDSVAAARGCRMTVYVDDMVFTGSGATRGMIYEARRVIGHHHLKGHKTKVFRAGQPRIITGVAVTKAGTKLPNKRQRKISEDRDLLRSLSLGREKLTVARRLAGRLYEAAQIDPTWRPQAEEIAGVRDAIQAALR